MRSSFAFMITYQNKSEQFLKELRPGQMLEPLFEAVPGVHYFVKDSQSRFITASLSFARMLGVKSVEELFGKTDFDYCPDFLARSFIEDDRKIMCKGKAILNKVELVPTHGSLDWLSTSKMPLYNHDGESVGLAGVTRVLSDSDALYHDYPEMRKIVCFIQSKFRDKITLTDIAREAGISVSSVERLFRTTFGVTPAMYLRKTRLNAACRKLRAGSESLAAIAEDCGLNDQTNMTRAFRQELKITPLRYRRRFSKPQRVGVSD
jgi:AraC-like DNA-binding protein